MGGGGFGGDAAYGVKYEKRSFTLSSKSTEDKKWEYGWGGSKPIRIMLEF